MRPFTAREAAIEVGVSYDYFTKMCREGRGPSCIRIGRKMLFRPEAIEEFKNKLESI